MEAKSGLPETMKYVQCEDKVSLAHVIKEGPLPKFNPSTEVLIKITNSGLNRAELLQARGLYPPPPGATHITGLECAGYLIDSDSHVPTNQKVMALLPGGGHGEYVTVNKGHIIHVPEWMEIEDAGGIIEQWCTAYQLLHFVSKV